MRFKKNTKYRKTNNLLYNQVKIIKILYNLKHILIKSLFIKKINIFLYIFIILAIKLKLIKIFSK